MPVVMQKHSSDRRIPKKKCSSITVKKEILMKYNKELIWNDFSHLTYVVVEENSLQQVPSLTITDLPEFTFFVCGSNSFSHTKRLTIKSTIWLYAIL